MEDKVLHEVRILETEDGFRIEIKGDKEHLRKMGFGKMGFGGMGFGPGMMFRRHRHHWGGPFGFRHGRGPWGWGYEGEDEGEAESTPRGEPRV